MNQKAFVIIFLMALIPAATPATAVKTVRVEHSQESEFKKGRTERIIISSEGVLSLAYETGVLVEANNDNWLINAIVGDEQGHIYAATSGAGAIYKIAENQPPTIIYGQGENDQQHVFSLAVDQQGRLLAGTGGDKGRLLRFDRRGAVETLFEEDKIAYIWCISVGPGGRIYFGAGPTGQVFTLDPDGSNPTVLYQAKNKNILAIALDAEGMVYAGGDTNGLVYQIDPATKHVKIVYDTGHQEISALVFDPQNRLYIATGDSRVRQSRGALILSNGGPGRPEIGDDDSPDDRFFSRDNTTAEPNANNAPSQENPNKEDIGESPDEPPAEAEESEEPAKDEPLAGPPTMAPPPRAGRANEVFKRVPQGYVTSLFSQPVVIHAMAYEPSCDALILGTGNDGQLLRIDINTTEAAIIHTAKPSVQISAVYVDPSGTVYAGLANPSGLIAIHPKYTADGQYLSEVIDAKQISQWGRIQIESDVPADAHLSISTRSGNTKDPEQGPWGEWTEPIPADSSVPVTSEPSRFLQYRLTFESEGAETPRVNRVTLAHTIPNLPPKMNSVTIKPTDKKNKQKKLPTYVSGQIDIRWKAQDDNQDQLLYQVYARSVDSSRWIRIEEDYQKPNMKWDTRTVADGRYEIKVEGCDSPDNPPAQSLCDSRISRPFVVDNSPPSVTEMSYSVDRNQVTIRAIVVDVYCPIEKAECCLDSEKDWKPALPDDGVFDSREETITYQLKIEEPGEHFLAVRFGDILDNLVYRNLIITIPEK